MTIEQQQAQSSTPPTDLDPAQSVQPGVASQQDDEGSKEDEAEAFADGFAKTRGDAAAPDQAAPSAEPSAPEDTPKAGNDEAVEAARIALAGLTEDQLKSLLARVPDVERKLESHESQMQKVTGKLGEFNRTLQQLQQMQSTGRPADQAAARKIAGDMLTRTKVLFPDLADAIANDLNEALFASQAPQQPQPATSGQPQVQGPTPEQLQQLVREQTEQVSRQYELKLLATKHPDYAEVAASADFKLWADTLPAADRAAVFESQDAGYVASKLDEYKAFRGQQANQRQRSQRRLAQAAPPTAGFSGQSPTTQSEEDAFLSGFARARGS